MTIAIVLQIVWVKLVAFLILLISKIKKEFLNLQIDWCADEHDPLNLTCIISSMTNCLLCKATNYCFLCDYNS